MTYCKRLSYCFFILLAGFACTPYPNDPHNTLDKVQNGTLRVGYSENKPWVIKTEREPGGTEAALIKSFAVGLQAKITWSSGSEEVLFKKLENREIDVIIAGLTDGTPWKTRKVGFTIPYTTTEKENYVIAVVAGENAFLTTLEHFLIEKSGDKSRKKGQEL